jgi:hypothetical protein
VSCEAGASVAEKRFWIEESAAAILLWRNPWRRIEMFSMNLTQFDETFVPEKYCVPF